MTNEQVEYLKWIEQEYGKGMIYYSIEQMYLIEEERLLLPADKELDKRS